MTDMKTHLKYMQRLNLSVVISTIVYQLCDYAEDINLDFLAKELPVSLLSHFFTLCNCYNN